MRCLQSWPPGCVTCIATLPWIALLALSVGIELVSSSVIINKIYKHQLFSDFLQIGSKFGHQVAPFALFAKLATRLRNLDCHIALDCPIGIIS